MRLNRSIAILALAGCTQDGLTALGGGVHARLALEVGGAATGDVVVLTVSYRQTNQASVTLADTTVTASAAPEQIPLEVDISECVADAARDPRGSGCPLRVTIVLKSAQGATIETQSLGPFDAVPGGIVNVPPVTLHRIASLELGVRRDTLDVGDTTSVFATVRDGQGSSVSGKRILWQSSDPTIATIDTSGLATALTIGTTTIVGKAADDTSKSATLTLVVRGVVRVDLAKDTIALSIRTTATTTATVTTVGAVAKTVRWLSSQPAIATVNPNSGLITAVTPGVAAIYAISTADTTKRDSLVLIALGITLNLSPGSTALEIGERSSVPVTVSSNNNQSLGISWASSNAAVATVGATGVITGVSAGSAVIRATAIADPLVTDSVVIAVRRYCVGAGSGRSGTISASQTWTPAGSPYRITAPLTVNNGAAISILPGVDVCLGGSAGFAFVGGARLVARGSATAPVVITAADTTQPWDILFFDGASTDSSYLTNAVVQHGSVGNPYMVWVNTPHTLVMDSTTLRRARNGAYLNQVGISHSRITRSRVEGSGSASVAAVRLGATTRISNSVIRNSNGVGLSLGAGNLDVVTVSGGSTDGIVVELPTGPISIGRTNVFTNAGVGIRNALAAPFSAPNLWWGDPAGPKGPNGDGVGPNVIFTPFAGAPFSNSSPLAAPNLSLSGVHARRP